jgi:nucleotide-binding universal stress UspA family protein
MSNFNFRTLKNVIDASKDLLVILHFSTHSVVSKHQFHHVSGTKSLDEHGVFVERDTRLIDAVKRQVKLHAANTGKSAECVFCDLYKSDGGESIIDFCSRYDAALVVVGKKEQGSVKSFFASPVSSFVMKVPLSDAECAMCCNCAQ